MCVSLSQCRKIFKVKKSDAEKSKKMEKEEKFFRNTFMVRVSL